MINGGLAAKNSFRKKNAVNAIQTKYPTTVVTAEEVAERDRLREADNLDMESEEEVVVQAKSKKSYTIDDIMQLDKKLQITKQAVAAVSKPIKKKVKSARRS